METLGERIRTLRKERKLTLVELAGNKMTKGMLSLIENNKATPSMDNLTYIAEKLNVPISELLEDKIVKEQQLLNKIQSIVDESKPFKQYAEAVWDLYNPQQFLSKQLSGARLAVYFGKSAYFMGEAIAPFFNHAEEVYKSFHASDLWVDAVIQRLRLIIHDKQYEEAIQLFTLKELEMKKFEVEPTPMRLLELYFILAALQFALGKYDKGMQTIENSFSISGEHHIYYMMNQLLRMAAAVEMMMNRKNYEGRYLNKLKQYARFSEDKDLEVYIPYIDTHYYTTFSIDTHQARTILENLKNVSVDEMYLPFLHLEWGKIYYYENEYEQALDKLLKVKSLEGFNHPIDLAVLASKYTYMVLIAQKLERADLMNQAVQQGLNVYECLPDSYYKETFFKTVDQIKITK